MGGVVGKAPQRPQQRSRARETGANERAGNAGSEEVDTRPSRPKDAGSVSQLPTQSVQSQGAVQKIMQAIAEGEASFTIESLKKAAGSVGISEVELERLFEEVDTQKTGTITRDQFLNGLRATPSIDGLTTLSSLLRSAGLLDFFAKSVLNVLQERLAVEHIDVDTLLRQAKDDDIRQGLHRAEDEVVDAVSKCLARMNSKSDSANAKTTEQFNDKFAYDNQTFEGVYLDLVQFRHGVEGALGLPGKDVYEGMKMEFCSSADSKSVFSTSNYDTSTTPEQEWEFVVSPDKTRSYPGGRTPVPLCILLQACAAKKANESGVRYDTPLADLSADEQDGVCAVLVRRVKEAGISKPFLCTAAESDARLKRLAGLSEGALGSIRDKIAAVLKSSPLNAATGQPDFSRMTEDLVRDGALSREEVFGLVEGMRGKMREAELNEEEVIALRLYTGPAFRKMNGTLRERDEGQRGNKYVSVIFAAVSGMVKVAETTPIPAGRRVYRGQKGMRLPESFWKGNGQGVKGGVEMAFLSTTTNFKVDDPPPPRLHARGLLTRGVQVARQYAAEGVLPTVFAIEVGAVDKGAALGFLSQYPDEEEILMPPRSFLEVVDEPAVTGADGGVVLTIPVKINCNLLCPTLEKLQQSRKTMLVSTLEHVGKEIVRDVDAMVKSEAVKLRGKADIFWKYPARRKEFVQSIKDESVRLLDKLSNRPPAWYNADVCFRHAMQQVMQLQRVAMGKLQLWLEERKLYITHLTKLSALDCERKAAGRLRRLMEDTEDSEEGRAERQALAARLCRHMELFNEEVDEAGDGQTALMEHAADGNLQAVHLLLSAGADANKARADGMTALLFAAQGGHAEVVRMLVREGGADPDARDMGTEGRTPLIHAAENGHTATAVTLLRDSGADASLTISSGAQTGDTAVYRAAYFGFGKTLQQIMEVGGLGVDALSPPKQNQWTATMAAAQNGHLEVVKWIVTDGKQDVNAINAEGKTALMLAASQGHEPVVRWLVEEGGAEVGVVDKNGSNVLMCAVQKADKATVAYLVDGGWLDINAVDSRGKTALVFAAAGGFMGCMGLVAKAGADVSCADVEGFTVLMLAVEQGQKEAVEWLVKEGGADVGYHNRRRGCTAAMVAAEKGHLDILQLLAEAKADLSVKNDHGVDALMLAVGEGQTEVVKWLVTVPGVEVGVGDALSWTALHCAVYTGKTDVAELLLPHNAAEERQAKLDEAAGHTQTYQSRALVVFKGLPWKVWVDTQQRTAKFTSFTTLRYRPCCPSGCKAYYELAVVEPLYCPQFGFATAKFKQTKKRWPKGVGDDAESWGVDGQRARKYHAGSISPYPLTWNVGDVVGLACDLASNQMLISVNGDFSEPNGTVYSFGSECPPEEVFAAFSALAGTVRFNFGEDAPFEHQPPSSDYVPIARAASSLQ